MGTSTIETLEYDVLDVFLPLAINGDDSGLTEDELSDWEAFEAKETMGLDGHWDYDSDEYSEFGECDITGMRGRTERLTFVITGRATENPSKPSFEGLVALLKQNSKPSFEDLVALLVECVDDNE